MLRMMGSGHRWVISLILPISLRPLASRRGWSVETNTSPSFWQELQVQALIAFSTAWVLSSIPKVSIKDFLNSLHVGNPLGWGVVPSSSSIRVSDSARVRCTKKAAVSLMKDRAQVTLSSLVTIFFLFPKK